MTVKKRLFVLDTNVLMHDPWSIFHFQEHSVYLPMKVLEEMDHHKRGMTETARNVRQVSRILDELVKGVSQEKLKKKGIPLRKLAGHKLANGHGRDVKGGLFFQTEPMANLLPDVMPSSVPDNAILNVVLVLKEKHSTKDVVLVSKDLNMRIKAAILGIHAEDYSSDQTIEDLSLLPCGVKELPKDFWEVCGADGMEIYQENGSVFYRLKNPDVKEWYPGLCIHLDDEDKGEFEAIVRYITDDVATVELIDDHYEEGHSVWGVVARNPRQNYALNLLLDPNIDFVTLLGVAGTGKTLLALAAGLSQVFDHKLYREIIVTRATVPVGEDIGYLPGTEDEKMGPWMGALRDNLEFLSSSESGNEEIEQSGQMMLRRKIRIHSMAFMRGRTFLERYIIIDEAQNLTSKQLKTLVTRAGPGSKIVCLGNIAQIDTPYLSETTSGLTYAVESFKNWDHSGHITLETTERSRLADFANEHL